MKIAFNIVIFVFIVIIGIVIMSTLLSSVFDISLFKRPGGSTEGILRSDDAGETWEARGILKDNEKKDFARITVTDFVFEPANPEIIYLITQGESVYRSEDAGEIWDQITDENGGLLPNALVFDISIEETNRDKIYLAVSQGLRGQVLKSVDKGAHFEEIYVTALEGEVVHAVAIDYYEPQTIYAGTSTGLLLESIDQGDSWRTVEQFSSGVLDIILNPRDTRTMYVVREGGVVSKSVDKGLIWVDIDLPSAPGGVPEFSLFPKKIGSGGFTSFSLNPSNPSHIFVVSGAGIFESLDAGGTFGEITTIIPTGTLPIHSFAIDPTNSRIMYLGVEGKIYKTLDGGRSWQIKGIPSLAKVSQILIDPANPQRVYIVLSQ